MNPLVSIIVPVYNVSVYIERCINSIMSQTYNNIECIIVDDVSPDDSIIKCDKLITDYKGPISFSIVHHDVNRGLSAARNTGTDSSKGEYLFFLDSDDDITSDCIEMLVSYVLEDGTVEMVQGNYVAIKEESKTLGKSDDVRIMCNSEARDMFLNQRKLNEFVWNKLIKKSFWVDNHLYNREGIINEDLLWMFYVIKSLRNACLCREVTYNYRIRSGSIATSTSIKKQGLSYAYIYDEILNNLSFGEEKGELFGFLYNFSYNMVAYMKYVPELKPVLHKYQRLARRFNSWYVWFVLTTIDFASRCANISKVLVLLNKIRRKLS